MKQFAFLNGNEAVAYGVKLSRPNVVAAYPITPQTKAVEKISSFVQNGELDCEYMHVESEHSAMACSIGASAVGARTFTATSSQGLLYMAECLPYASGARLPIVMMNANRSLATPWNIYGDQMDAMFLLNAGWIQIFVEDAQEALDMTIQSFMIAEHKKVMAPVMINLDGFVLTHTYEKVDIPKQEDVDAFLPAFKGSDHLMNDETPMSMCITAGNNHNMEFKVKQHQDMFDAFEVIERTEHLYKETFGRAYGGAIEGYMHEDAEVLLVTTGSVTGTARVVVDEMRAEGKKVGLLKLRIVRPFPTNQLNTMLTSGQVIGVVDKNISFGYEGTIYTNVNSAILQTKKDIETFNFIGGIGGRDITKANIREMYEGLYAKSTLDTVSYYNVRCAL